MRLCEVCKKELKTGKRSDAKYCSRKCRQKRYDQSPKGKEACVRKVKHYHFSEKGIANRRKANKKYYRGHKEKWNTQEKWDRSHASQRARKIMKAEGVVKECVECHSSKNVQVHHRDEDWQNNELSNLVYLCRKCHLENHGKVSKYLNVSLYPIKRYTDDDLMNFLIKAYKRFGHSPTQGEFLLFENFPEPKTYVDRGGWNYWKGRLAERIISSISG